MEQPLPQQQPYQYSENMHRVDTAVNNDRTIQQRITNKMPIIILILAFVQLALNFLIFGMEIGIIVCYVQFVALDSIGSLPYGEAAIIVGPLTAAGIWISIINAIMIAFLFILVKRISDRRMWLINIVTQSISLVFIIILIGITGNYVDTKSGYQSVVCGSSSSAEEFKYVCTKYQLHQAQLAFAILMLFSAILLIGLFLYFYFVLRNFPDSATSSDNSYTNNNQLGVQQQKPWEPSSLPVNSRNNNNNQPNIQQQGLPNPELSSRSQQIQYPHYQPSPQLPVLRETSTPSEPDNI